MRKRRETERKTEDRRIWLVKKEANDGIHCGTTPQVEPPQAPLAEVYSGGRSVRWCSGIFAGAESNQKFYSNSVVNLFDSRLRSKSGCDSAFVCYCPKVVDAHV
ncbi:unnamed protein product [Sphagnum troendelagicum]|uniref:Uncharacterized protein n=1 Tax=Sphagnum troendelagicum TaxID=128251 RepID=A0ABP0U6B8_9BRYO